MIQQRYVFSFSYVKIWLVVSEVVNWIHLISRLYGFFCSHRTYVFAVDEVARLACQTDSDQIRIGIPFAVRTSRVLF